MTGIRTTASCESVESNIRHIKRVRCLQEEMSRRGSTRDYGPILHGNPVTIWNTYMCICIVLHCLWCGLEMKIFKNKILEKIFFFKPHYSKLQWIFDSGPKHCMLPVFLSLNSSMSLCQAVFNNLYLSKQPFHVDLLENGISASCHLMFSSRPFTQVSFLAGPQQAVGGSS